MYWNMSSHWLSLRIKYGKKVLKKISNMTKFYCPNKSIYYFFKINNKISTINVKKFRNWCPRGGSMGEGAPGGSPYPKIGKNMIFWRKIVIFHTKYPNNFRTSLRPAQFFLTAPPNLKSWIRPYWPQYVHYQCHSRRWIQNWSVWDIFCKWLKLC